VAGHHDFHRSNSGLSSAFGTELSGFETQIDPVAGSEAFTGLLNSSSLLEELLVTWPTQLASLGEQSVRRPAAGPLVTAVGTER
jgi:hypothetical protein